MTIPPQFNIAYEFSEGLAPVKIGTGCELCGKWGFIDKTGKVVIEPRFEAVNDFSEGLAVFTQRGR
jgi:WG containing repeat